MNPRAPVFGRTFDYLDYHAATQPTAEAMVHLERRWSWRELKVEVDRWARALLALGVTKGDRVACLSTPRPEFWISFLAASRIGAIWVGLNPRYTQRELAYVMRDSAPVLLVALARHGDRDFLPDIGAVAAETHSLRETVIFEPGEVQSPSLDRFLQSGNALPEGALKEAGDAVGPRDPTLIVYTSGTTGAPKGAILAHWGLSYCSQFQNRAWGTRRAQTRIINFFPVNHLASVGDISCFVLVAGGALIWMEQFDPAAVLDLVAAENVTLLGGVPTMIQMIFAQPDLDEYDLSSLETIAIGGAAVPLPLIRKLRRYVPSVSTGYGSTETVGHMTFTPPAASDEQIALSIGLPVPEYRLRIAGPDDRSLWPGEEGEIQVEGDFLFLGYHNRPGETAEAFTSDGWYKTGDIAVAQPDGTWRLVGRKKEMYKSGGYNIYPREIEIVLEDHPLVEMAAVVGIPDPLYQEVGHAFVLTLQENSLDEESLITHCKKYLANYKLPKRFTISNRLPILPVGKIDKQALKTSWLSDGADRI